MKKLTAKKITQREIDKDILDLRKFVLAKLEKLGSSYHLVKECGNYLLVSKLLNLNIHITNERSIFQPLVPRNREIPYPVITLIELCTELGKPKITNEEEKEVKRLMKAGVQVLKVHPETVIMDKMSRIGEAPLS